MANTFTVLGSPFGLCICLVRQSVVWSGGLLSGQAVCCLVRRSVVWSGSLFGSDDAFRFKCGPVAGVNVAWWTQPNPSWPWDCAEVPTVTGLTQTGHGRLAKGKLAMTDWPKANWPWDWLKQIGCRAGPPQNWPSNWSCDYSERNWTWDWQKTNWPRDWPKNELAMGLAQNNLAVGPGPPSTTHTHTHTHTRPKILPAGLPPSKWPWNWPGTNWSWD